MNIVNGEQEDVYFLWGWNQTVQGCFFSFFCHVKSHYIWRLKGKWSFSPTPHLMHEWPLQPSWQVWPKCLAETSLMTGNSLLHCFWSFPFAFLSHSSQSLQSLWQHFLHLAEQRHGSLEVAGTGGTSAWCSLTTTGWVRSSWLLDEVAAPPFCWVHLCSWPPE